MTDMSRRSCEALLDDDAGGGGGAFLAGGGGADLIGPVGCVIFSGM